MPHRPSARLDALPPYLFVDIENRCHALRAAGADVIDFGVGDPDLATPTFIREQLRQAIQNQDHHRYPPAAGVTGFRKAACAFLARRYGASLADESNALPLIGSKEGLAHLPLAILNPGDAALVPDPGYPVYRAATLFAGADPITLPLHVESNWLPDFDAIPTDDARRARLLFLNYPNNPTGACATRAMFENAISFCKQHEIILAHDAAYGEMYFDPNARPLSVLELPSARDLAIEFHSLSKTFCMTGWRLGFAVGNPDLVRLLARIKANIDSGPFGAIQEAGAAALSHADHEEVRTRRETYSERARSLATGLQQLGFQVAQPRATFYVWAKPPGGVAGMEAAQRILDDAHCVCIPGIGFGEQGAAYVRFAVTVPVERIQAALDRLRKLSW